MKNFTAGIYISQGTYKSFQPEHINKGWKVENMELIQLLGQADRELGRLDMFSDYVPNIDLFIQMHVLKEATKSSKIEGTKTNMEEALLDKEDVAEEKRDDWEEVQNYIQALNTTIKDLIDIPFSSRLIKNTHKILLQAVRGKHKLPGQFRTSQNWVGGASITDATFVPPTHTSVSEYMSDLETFFHNTEIPLPHLLKIALIHYQFETIHPFLDGNGRVGRLMITLYLVEKKILKKPILYLSDFFERNRLLYYDHLTKVRQTGDLMPWFKFFLVGVIETAKSSIQAFDSILKLQQDVENKIQSLGSQAGAAHKIINQMYQHPLMNVSKAKEVTGLSFPSVYKLIDKLEQMGIVKEMTGGKRGKQYLFNDYLNLYL